MVLLALGACTADLSIRDKVINYRVRSQNLHIDHLEDEVDKLEHTFDHFSRPLTKWDVSMLRTRVQNNEGDKCPAGEVSCHGDFPECISRLFVCDGHVDCHNGNDEEEDVCESEMVHVGSTYQGVIEWESCENLPDSNVIMTVTAVYHAPFFNNRVYLRATFVSDSTNFDIAHPVATTMHGYYSFADRKLTLVPDHSTQLHHPYTVTCSFHFGDNDHADCTVNEVASLTECAKLRVVTV